MSISKKNQDIAVRRAKGRLVFTGIVVFFVFLAIGFRLADLTLVSYIKDETTHSPTISKNNDPHLRGDIVDANDNLIASSVQISSVYADPTLVKNPKQTAESLARIFPTLKKKKLTKLLDSNKRFVWIKRHITPREKYAVNRLGEPGLGFKKENRRLYPQGSLLSHVTGYTDIDNYGLSGVEKSLETQLINNDKALKLTIDSRIQHIVRDELSQAIDSFDAKGGAAIVMEAKTGRLLSMTSLPDFDPHQIGQAAPDHLFNKASLGVYEMGSTFKIFSAAAGLEFTKMRMKDSIDCRKPLQYGRFTIRDFHAQKRMMTFPEVFIHSSNIGHAKIAEKVGTEKFKAFLADLGFFDPLPLALPEKGKPLTPQRWRDINTVTASYGHGVAVTPLHLVTAAAGIVNGGTKVKPQFISHESKLGKKLISEETSKHINEMLRLTVLEGTGKNADVEGYLVGGKTGTAEKNSGGQYDDEALISSFLGVFPMNDPQYIIYVMVDEPVGNQRSYGYATGGWVAAPVVKNIIRRMTSLLGIPPLTHQQARSFDLSMQVNRIPMKKKSGEKIVAAH